MTADGRLRVGADITVVPRPEGGRMYYLCDVKQCRYPGLIPLSLRLIIGIRP